MIKLLRVNNLSASTTGSDLSALFGVYGTVASARVATDAPSGRSRGYGFVELASGGGAAIRGTNMASFQGRLLIVRESRPGECREDLPAPGPSGGGTTDTDPQT